MNRKILSSVIALTMVLSPAFAGAATITSLQQQINNILSLFTGSQNQAAAVTGNAGSAFNTNSTNYIQTVGSVSPTLKIKYDSTNKESVAVATFNITISAGATDQHISKYFDIQFSSGNTAIGFFGENVAGTANVATDQYGGYTIKAGQTLSLVVTGQVATANLFGGVYTATLTGIPTVDITTNPVTIVGEVQYSGTGPSALSTNSAVIIGETSPFITSVTGSDSNNVVTVTGYKFSEGEVVSIGGKTFVVTTSPVAGKTGFRYFTFIPSQRGIGPGSYSLQIKGTGLSNIYGLTLYGAPVSPEVKVLGSSLKTERINNKTYLTATYDVSIKAGSSDISFYPNANSFFVDSKNQQTYSVIDSLSNFKAISGAVVDGSYGAETVPAGKVATVRITRSLNADQMFAGSYTATLLSLTNFAKGGDYTLPYNKTNAVTIVGEVIPTVVAGANPAYGDQTVPAGSYAKIGSYLVHTKAGVNAVIPSVHLGLLGSDPSIVSQIVLKNNDKTIGVLAHGMSNNYIPVSASIPSNTDYVIDVYANIAASSSGYIRTTLTPTIVDNATGLSIFGQALVGQQIIITPAQTTVDVCPNIPGFQNVVPAGDVVDSSGNCVPATIVTPTPFLNLTSNPTFSSQNVVANTPNVEIGSYVLSASSTEAVVVNSLNILVSSSSPLLNLTNLHVVLPGTATNSISPVTVVGGVAPSTMFTTNFTIPAGGSQVINVFADIGSVPDTIKTGVQASGKGAISGQNTYANIALSEPFTIVPLGSGSLSIPTPTLVSSATLPSQYLIGPSTASIATYNIVSTSTAITIGELRFNVTPGTVSAMAISVNGSMLQAQFPIAGVVDFTGLSIPVPAGAGGVNVVAIPTYSTVLYQGGIASNSSSTIHLVGIQARTGNITGYLGTSHSGGNGTLGVAGEQTMYLVASKPGVSISSNSNQFNHPADGSPTEIADVSVYADASGGVSINTIPLHVTTSGLVTIDSQLLTVRDSNNSVVTIATGTLAVSANSSSDVNVVFQNGYRLAPGTSQTFKVFVTSSNVKGTPGSNTISTKLGNASAFMWTDTNGNMSGLTGVLLPNYPTNVATTVASAFSFSQTANVTSALTNLLSALKKAIK